MSDEQKNIKFEKSEIINQKKQLIFKVDQASDFVYPNEKYKYQIYCKNVSGSTIKNVCIQIINPSAIYIDEDDKIPSEGIEIGDLKNGQSHLIFVSARAGTIGEFTVHFLCYGEESGLFVESPKINCNYNSYNNKTIHRINIYNFSPYEETYELHSKDYNEDVTQLIKKQKLPYKAKENPFKMISSDNTNRVIIDESENYIDQKNTLYEQNKYNSDEHSYQYIEREIFNKEAIESFEGESLIDVFNKINKYSKFFKGVFLKTGTNVLKNDFKQYNPDGFIYRFGLMNSEIYHHLGVLPEYSYMNDYLFRWASEGQIPVNLYPKLKDMNWDRHKWTGRGWNVWKTYTDEYKEQIIDKDDFKPLFEFIHTFENLKSAQEFIDMQYEFDTSNEFYISTENGFVKIRKYKYLIKESYFENGVFFVHIPISRIPSNFFLLDTDEIEAIIEKTKPYGMKALIRYMIDVNFNINMELKSYCNLHPNVNMGNLDISNLSYYIQPYQYNNVIEEFCYQEDGENVYEEREVIRLIPDGTGYYNMLKLYMNPSMRFFEPNPTSFSNLDIGPTMESEIYECETDNDLTFFSQIQELLYQNNFETISFYIKNILTKNITEIPELIDFDKISAVDYQLWIDSLEPKNQNPHSHWWDIEIPENENFDETYYFSDLINGEESNREKGKIDFMEIPLTSQQLIREGVEVGIGFEDSNGKLHGISSEMNKNLNSFNIKYATSYNNNFKIKKEGFGEIIGLAFKFIYINNNTLIVFFLKEESNNAIKYHYFTHTIVNKINSLFCFTRNNKDISSIKKWSNIIQTGISTDIPVIFNTPQYKNLDIYDPKLILNEPNWQNIHRIDRKEHSYAFVKNSSKDVQEVDDILLHFDEINIPDDAIVKNIRLKTIMESNSYKYMYPSIRIEDGFITEKSSRNNIFLHPSQIECYAAYNNNTKYYEEQYYNAKINNIEKSIKLFKNKIEENKIFNDSLDYSTDFLNNIDDYIIVNKGFWIELSDFSNYSVSFNEIKDIKLYIEGYNPGKEINLTSQLKQNNLFAKKNDTKIPTGYFKKYISLSYYNQFSLEDIQLRFRFKNLNDDLHLFDTCLIPTFKTKLNENKNFLYVNNIDIEKKKVFDTDLIESELPSYLLKNGLTVKLEFDDLEVGEYYRIYSVELDIIYQRQSIDLLANSNSYEFEEYPQCIVANGDSKDSYISAMFFNELIMPGTYQEQSTLSIDNQGIELEDALYQSFIATKDNITSITLYPNGFIGNPDLNLKIALYENKGNTPNRLVKEIRASGWTKSNKQLKNNSIIKYNFNVNNLEIGETYWLKLEVENPKQGNYYLLKYTDSPQKDLKLLTRVNNNLINTFGALKFHINTLNSFKSFNSFPVSENSSDFNNPNIFIGLNKGIGEIKKIKVQKMYKDISEDGYIEEDDTYEENEYTE